MKNIEGGYKMSDFKIRALEIHSSKVWDYNWVTSMIEFIKQHNMNTLILHRNDIVDSVVYPAKYFGAKRLKYNNIYERYQDVFRSLYKYTPTRRSRPIQKSVYLNRVIEMAKREGLNVYVENKELYFPGIILEFFPNLIKNGKICPNEPFWWEFIKEKYTEFYDEFPGIDGVITAPATGESKVSITSNRCTCELCTKTSKSDWFIKLILSMYEPARAAGKTLVIRDFVFDPEAHNEISTAMVELPDDIVFALKNTPHDYYPTFPNNPRIGKIRKHEQWIEYDTMGQYFGWGIGISIMIDDMKRRFLYAKENRVDGVILRTDWEGLDGHTVFDTLNSINVYAGAVLTNHLDCNINNIYQQWLSEQELFIPNLTPEDKKKTAMWIGDIMGRTWDVMRKTNYVNDCVFSDSSMLPISMEHAIWLAEEKNSLKVWDKSKEYALNVNEENVKYILAEKDEALRIIKKLLDKIYEGHKGITKGAHEDLVAKFEIYEKYVKAFKVDADAIILAKYVMENKNYTKSVFYEEALNLLREKLKDLLIIAGEFRKFYNTTDFSYTVYEALDADRLIALHSDLCQKLHDLI